MTNREPRSTSPRSRRAGAVAIVACVCAVAVAVTVVMTRDNGGVRTVDGSTSDAAHTVPKRAAERVAAALRDSAVLPSGAKATTATPPKLLSGPLETLSSPNLVDVHRLWIVAEPSEQVVGFLRTHAPRGMANGTCCATAGGPEGTAEMVQFFDPADRLPSSDIMQAQLQVTVAHRTATSSWVRVDAQAVWRARRDPSERVPETDRVVTIALEDSSNTATRPIVVSDRQTVERLEASFNALLVAVPVVSNGCGFEPTYTVAFSTTRTARPDVTAILFCGGARVTIDSRAAAALDAVKFTSEVAAVFPH